MIPTSGGWVLTCLFMITVICVIIQAMAYGLVTEGAKVDCEMMFKER